MPRLRVLSIVLFGLALTGVGTAGCVNPLTALPKLFEARRLASELHVSFTRAADASNRAVMADTDEASIAAKDEATAARQAVDHDLETLQPILTELGYADELRELAAFKTRYEEYRRLDDEILPLAIENSNLKAQRLSFGDAQEAAKAFRASLDAAVRLAPPAQANAAALLADRAEIGSSRDSGAAGAAHRRVRRCGDDADGEGDERLDDVGEGGAGSAEGDAATGSDTACRRRCGTRAVRPVNTDIIALSRKNTNVRSLALSLGRKRVVTAECEDQLRALGEALAKHESTATR